MAPRSDQHPSVMWFYVQNGSSQGPLTEEAIVSLLRAGTLTGETPVWTAGAAAWRRWEETALASYLHDRPPAPPAAPPPLPPSLSAPSPSLPTTKPVAPPTPPVVSGPGRITPLTVQPGSVARESFSAFCGLLGFDAPRAGGGDTKPGAAAELSGVHFWTARMGETTLGGLVGRGIKPEHFEWLMPLETVALGDGRTVGPAYVGVTTNGLLQVFFHIKGEGFYYAAMPVAVATARWEPAEPGGQLRGTLDFPPATGLKRAVGEALRPDWLVGLNAAWLRFWQPAVLQGWGSMVEPGGKGPALALGRLTEFCPVDGKFGLEVTAEEAAVFFRPGLEGGLACWPKNIFADDPVESWHVGADGSLELAYHPEGDLVYVVQLVEHVPEGGEAALPGWLPALKLAPAARVEVPPTETLRQQGCFTTLWENEERAVSEQIYPQDDTLAWMENGGASGKNAVFDRGGFVFGNHALAVTSTGRCARLTLADPHTLDRVPRFAPGALRLEPWAAEPGSLGTGVLIRSEDSGIGDPRPAKFTLFADRFSVGPLRDQPLREEDQWEYTEEADGFGSLRFHPAAPAPDQPALAPLTVLLPRALALQLWEEWDVARAKLALAKANVGGFYREFNEAKKLNLLVILFADVVLLNQALNKGISLEDTVEKLQEGGEATLKKDQELRRAVVAKILSLVQTLPSLKQKLELMASMYPYYWVHQEVEWLKAAFGPATGTALESSLRKRAVPLVRREVRTVQGNLSRALGEIEAAARPIEGLLSRDEVRRTWTAQARRYLPLAAQGASALAMVVMSHGTYGWTGLASFLASGVAGNVFESVTRDDEAVNRISRAAQSILPWWRVFLHALVTTQFEFSQFVDDENGLAMKRDRALLDKVPAAQKQAATDRLVRALRERILAERRNRFAEVLAGSGVLMGNVADDLAKTITDSAHADVAEFIKMFQPVRSQPQPDQPKPH